jgi:type VI protein secretion system component VasF
MLKPLIQIALKLLRLKLKTKSVIIPAPMESMRQSVMYYNSYILKVGKQRCINRQKINHVED